MSRPPANPSLGQAGTVALCPCLANFVLNKLGLGLTTVSSR
jgi:hypothetical protein